MSRPRLIVDGSNVMGARPDGWWRDRPGARILLTTAIDERGDGLCAATTGDPGAEVLVVHDGRPIEMQLLRVLVAFAGHADDLIVAEARGGDVVVTSDRELAQRVRRTGATVVGSGAFRRLLDEVAIDAG